MSNKEKLIKLLKSYGVNKCRVDNVDFSNPRPCGRIQVDVYNIDLLNEIILMYIHRLRIRYIT